MKTIVSALVALGLAAVAAPAAHAETISYGADGALVVTAAPGEKNHLGIQSDAGGSGRVLIYEGTDGVPLSGPDGPCENRDYATLCDWTPSAGVRVDLGDGDDWGYVSFDLPANARFSLAGGPGDDRLEASLDGQPTTLDGGPGRDALTGGPGADTLLGGDDADTLEGKAGPDRLDGGAGDDLLSGDANKSPAADVIDGGAGYDRIESDWSDSSFSAAPQPVALTLGGGADDGRPGEGDDVRNVERIVSHSASRLVGTDAAEYLEVFQVSAPSELIGGGGNDTLKANDGADRLDGGAGDDDIDAGFGDDTIVGGPGRDSIAGDRRGGDCGPLWCKLPFGNDTIDARDGERDSVMCGLGEDSVQADAVDVVAADCEHVTRAGAAPAPAPAPSGGGAGGLSASVAKVKLAKALAHGLKLRVSAPAAGRLTAGAKGASGSAKVQRAGTATVVLRFTTAARRKLRRARTVKLAVAVRFTPTAGAAVSQSLKVTLKR